MTPVTPGATDVSVHIRIIDSADGTPETGVTSATSGLALWYRVGATGAQTSITEADLAAVTTAHADGGMKHVGEGVYRVDLPDAAVPASEGVVTWVGGAVTGMIVIPAAIVGRIAIGATGSGLTSLAPSATALSTAQWSNTRAGYLDNLSAGAAATAAKLLSYVQSMLRSDVTVDTDIGGTYDDATDSQQAIRDRGDAAWGASGVATQVWGNSDGVRTLTQGAASVVTAVTGSAVTQYRGVRWSFTLTGMTDFTGYTGLWFGVKRSTEDADADAICLVKTTTGLIYFDGDDTITAGHGAIVVNSSTSITVTVEADATQYATPGTYQYAVKALNASGKPFMVSAGGVFTIAGDIPLAIS